MFAKLASRKPPSNVLYGLILVTVIIRAGMQLAIYIINVFEKSESDLRRSVMPLF